MTEDVTIRRYLAEDVELWNGFVRQAANATFLHDRGFMDYHADRFQDHSLIIEKAGKPVALLPANRVGDVLQSHGGLTYGGLLVRPRQPAVDVVQIVDALRSYMQDTGLASLLYKPSPYIFHQQPSDADIYALVNAGARPVRTDLGSAIPLRRRQPFSGGRKDGIRKARKAGLIVKEMDDLAGFWQVLEEVLAARHEAAPTHNLEEITLLAQRFPDQIRLFATHDEGAMLAGLLVFDCGMAVHAQYIATSAAGRDLGALDLLVDHLVSDVFADRDWFSFGISTTDAGRTLNVGLSRQKEMFGGHSVIFAQYQWDIG